ncbi:hypothetical protein [Chroococcidiopsis sp. CCMEE 29]|uniref:hypothetical protein n=1 Tax=Chroococcidiopsis sp. CCMEE 29 TaxID=155894 RepID=UPI002020BD14|nr:hypothetical protein [Chroococcidiopsis sp. CCMEE 29]
MFEMPYDSIGEAFKKLTQILQKLGWQVTIHEDVIIAFFPRVETRMLRVIYSEVDRGVDIQTWHRFSSCFDSHSHYYDGAIFEAEFIRLHQTLKDM